MLKKLLPSSSLRTMSLRVSFLSSWVSVSTNVLCARPSGIIFCRSHVPQVCRRRVIASKRVISTNCVHLCCRCSFAMFELPIQRFKGTRFVTSQCVFVVVCRCAVGWQIHLFKQFQHSASRLDSICCSYYGFL